MANNTTLNPGSGGDVIATEDCGTGYKVAVTKLRTGGSGTDGGDVTAANPLPVQIYSAASTAEAAGTGITQPTGGAGLLGFLSGIYNRMLMATADALTTANTAIASLALFNGTTSDRARSAPGTTGVVAVSADGVKATYRYYSSANTPAATPTDVFTIAGSATKTIRIKKVVISGLATTAGQFVWSLIRRSAANTGGTSTAPAAMKHDTNDAAATATLALYTANPSGLGTTVGTVRGGRLFHNVSTAQNDRVEFNFSTNQDKALILRGATDILAINGAGGTLPAGATLDIEIEWEEDNS